MERKARRRAAALRVPLLFHRGMCENKKKTHSNRRVHPLHIRLVAAHTGNRSWGDWIWGPGLVLLGVKIAPPPSPPPPPPLLLPLLNHLTRTRGLTHIKISRARAQRFFTSLSFKYSQRISCSIWRSKSELVIPWIVNSASFPRSLGPLQDARNGTSNFQVEEASWG